MTLQEAKSIARHLGLTLRMVRSGSYRVNFRDGNEASRTISKMPSVPRLRWLGGELSRRYALTANNRYAENSHHRDCVAADGRDRAAIPAPTATETAGPMVPRGLDGERQLLRTGVRQGAGRYPQERLVSGRLARERQLLHPLRGPQLRASWHHQRFQLIAKPPKPSQLPSPHDD
jgi:hypothetical protein